MSGAARAALVWSAFLAGLATMLWIWTPGDELAIALLGGAAVSAVVLGFALALRGTERDRPVRPLPDLSLGAALAAIALTAILIGLEAGEWLVLIGGGLLATALALLARELQAERGGR